LALEKVEKTTPPMSSDFLQVRGEITHEFSFLEYEARPYLADLLAKQPNRQLDKYGKQFDLFVQFFSPAEAEIQWNPKVLENPDVQFMDAELTAAEGTFAYVLDQLKLAAHAISFPKMNELSSLVEDLKEAASQRNIFIHSVWHEIEGEIVLHNFPDYHREKYIIKGDGKGGWERLTPQHLAKWKFQELKDYATHLRGLSERLKRIFQA
jgi:hypothetical protein